MKNRLVDTVIASLTVLFFAQAALADRVDRRQVRQRARIAEGVKSGELTRQEAKELRAGERHVRRLERRIDRRSDGDPNAQQEQRLENAQDRLSQRIHNEKHDDQKREGN